MAVAKKATSYGKTNFLTSPKCVLLFMGFSRQGYWSGLPFPSLWTTFCQTSPPWPVRLGWPHTTWLSFIELDMAVVLWSDWLVSCDYGFSVPALWYCHATPTILLGFLWLWTWDVSSRLLLTLDEGYLLTAAPPDLERGVTPLGPLVPAQLLLLGHGVASWEPHEQYEKAKW